jgi:hypothetical protein
VRQVRGLSVLTGKGQAVQGSSRQSRKGSESPGKVRQPLGRARLSREGSGSQGRVRQSREWSGSPGKGRAIQRRIQVQGRVRLSREGREDIPHC